MGLCYYVTMLLCVCLGGADAVVDAMNPSHSVLSERDRDKIVCVCVCVCACQGK